MKTIWWAEPPTHDHLTTINGVWDAPHFVGSLHVVFKLDARLLEVSKVPPHVYLGDVAAAMTRHLQRFMDRN